MHPQRGLNEDMADIMQNRFENHELISPNTVKARNV
jgi:hypothetical protein